MSPLPKTPFDSHDATRWFQRLGPGIVTACVVIGPGSIISSTKVGATHGFSTAWIVVVACLLMMAYMTLGARLGVITQRSAGDLLTQKTSRWFAALTCGGLGFISLAYQFGNNLAVHAAFNAYRGEIETLLATDSFSGWLGFLFDWGIVLILNGIALTFIFAFKELYRMLERVMTGFVALMLVAFAINLFFARPDLSTALKGLIPQATNDHGESLLSLELLALVGTTFVISAAFYQSYLVRFRGWKTDQLRAGLVDARFGAVIMMVLTLMIITTAAAVFFGSLSLAEIESMSATDVANQLRPAFGDRGKLLFCVGLFSAAYSSFIVNSMIGGFIISDGLGLGDRPEHPSTRIFTAVVLIVGMLLSLAVTNLGWNPVSAIVAAQGATVIFAPLAAAVLWWLTASKDVMGPHRNRTSLNVVAAIGLIVLVAMAFRLAVVEIPKRWMSSLSIQSSHAQSFQPPSIAQRVDGSYLARV